MWWLKKREPGDSLAVALSGVRLGDRVLVVGAGDPDLVAGLGIKAGLTGRTCLVDDDEARTTGAAARIEREGALVEPFTAPWTVMPFEGESFDLVVIRDVLGRMPPERRVGCLQEVVRVLRGGGRCLVIEAAPRGGLGALVSRGTDDPIYIERGGALKALGSEGFRAVRTLAEREGLRFVEGVKANLGVLGHTSGTGHA